MRNCMVVIAVLLAGCEASPAPVNGVTCEQVPGGTAEVATCPGPDPMFPALGARRAVCTPAAWGYNDAGMCTIVGSAGAPRCSAGVPSCTTGSLSCIPLECPLDAGL